DPEERKPGCEQREGAGQCRGDGEAEANEARRVVRKRLPLEDAHHPPGTGTRAAIAETAIGSVGERTAARANATGSGIAGIIVWMSMPAPTTVNTTRPSASSRIVPRFLIARRSGFASRRGRAAEEGRAGRRFQDR